MGINKSVHIFGALDRFFALDSASGNIFETDAITAHLLAKRTGESLVTGLVDFSQAEEAEKAIDALVDEGVLFACDNHVAPINATAVKALCLNLCHDCNLRCGYCFAEDGTYGGRRTKMSRETAFGAVDLLIKESGNRRALEIDFFGGEPLLNMDVLKATVDYATTQAAKCGKSFRFTVTTNGLLLDRKTSDYFNSVMDNVVISIDGRKEIHNAIRCTPNGVDVFDRIIDNSRYFRSIRNDRDYYIRGTYTAQNLDFTNDVAFLFDAGFDKISLEPVVLPPEHPLAITEKHVPHIKSEYDRLARYYLEQNKAGKKLVFFHFMLDFGNAPCLRKLVTACGAGCEYLAVSPDGGVYPCHRFVGCDAYHIGAFDSNLDRGLMHSLANCNIYSKDGCGSCWARYFCSGGCNANNYYLCGSVTRSHSLSCEIMRARLESAIAVNICKNC